MRGDQGGRRARRRRQAADAAHPRRRRALPRGAPVASTTTASGSPSTSLPMEQYVRGVVPAEVAASSWPQHAMRAQAVAARTYAAYEREHTGNPDYDLCDTAACQAYGGASRGVPPPRTRAVAKTARQVLTHAGRDGVRAVLREQRRLDRRRRPPLPAGAGGPLRGDLVRTTTAGPSRSPPAHDRGRLQHRQPHRRSRSRPATATARAAAASDSPARERRRRAGRAPSPATASGGTSGSPRRSSRSPSSTDRTTRVCSSRRSHCGARAGAWCRFPFDPIRPCRHTDPGSPAMRRRPPVARRARGAAAVGRARGPGGRADDTWRVPGKAWVTIKGHGYGHGHGMSQYGAEGAARQGLTLPRDRRRSTTRARRWGTAKGRVRVVISADTTDDLVVLAAPGPARCATPGRRAQAAARQRRHPVADRASTARASTGSPTSTSAGTAGPP